MVLLKNRACVTNLLESYDFLTKAYADKDSVDMVLLDFAKAFDTVPHKRLLLKITKYGIDNQVLAWIKSFLSNRRQRVILGDSISSWLPVTSGVQQGSVLGPTLFILFINDLPDMIKNNCLIYADDTKIAAKIRQNNITEDIQMLQSDINIVKKWTDMWLVRLNDKKCKVMHFGKKTQMQII